MSPRSRLLLLASAILLISAFFYASRRRPNAEGRLELALKNQGTKRVAVFPLAGTVTVDGQPPSRAGMVLVMLSDPSKPDTPRTRRRFARCEPDGTFAFTTYMRGDGVEPGDYVVTFVQIKATRALKYAGPDEFGNLHSDLQKSEFKIEHKPPGRKDLEFDLQIARQVPVEAAPANR
jgi:hypothetical protein